jgi:hypothetical protein
MSNISQETTEEFTQLARAMAEEEGFTFIGEDVDVQKYLIGRAGNQQQALSQFKQAQLWRRDAMNVETLLQEDFGDYESKGLLYIPRDRRAKDGSQLGFFRSWEHLPTTAAVTERTFRFMVYALEKARRDGIIKAGDTMTLVYDRKYAERKNMDFTLMRRVISEFQVAYPEWLARFIFGPTNFLVQTGWSIAKSILDVKTTDKLQLCSASEFYTVLNQYVDPSSLPRRYNGTWKDKWDLAECEAKNPKFSDWKREGHD